MNNYKQVKVVLWVILFANLLVAMIKVVVGTIVNSTSMIADGYHSLTDGTSNVVGLIGIHFASKPVDEDHPYGHAKFELVAGVFISIMLLTIGLNVVLKAFERILHPETPTISVISLLLLVVTLIINILVSTSEFKIGKKLNSTILVSDSIHTRSDIFISLGVLTSLVGIKLGLPAIIDPIASFVVAGFIFHAAYDIFKENTSILVDKVAVEPEKIKEIVLSFEEVKDTHKIRSRGNEIELHIDLHIMTEPNLSVEQSHELVHSIENKMQLVFKRNVQLIAHIEPFKIQ